MFHRRFAVPVSWALTAAAPVHGYSYTFPGQADASLGQCGSLDLSLDGRGSGEAPYYFFVYQSGSVPSIQTIQEADRGALSDAIVQARAGSQVILTMVDSAGEAGGVSSVYNVEGTLACSLYTTDSLRHKQTPLLAALASQPTLGQLFKHRIHLKMT